MPGLRGSGRLKAWARPVSGCERGLSDWDGSTGTRESRSEHRNEGAVWVPQELLENLRRDLVGPGSDDEVIADPPVTRYATGVLFPQDAGIIDAEQDVDTADDDDEATFGDPPVAMANTRYPSSMGMTFGCRPAAGTDDPDPLVGGTIRTRR